MPQLPSRLTRLRAFAPYVLLYLTHLRVLRGSKPRALSTRLLRFLCTLKFFLGLSFSAAKTFNFPRTIKGITKRDVFILVKKQP